LIYTYSAKIAKLQNLDLRGIARTPILILPGVPLVGVYNQNTVGENGDFQPVHRTHENISPTVSNMATVTINRQ